MSEPHQGASEEPEVALGARIEKAKRELERMVDLNPQGMLLVDPDGVVMRINRSLMNLLGFRDFDAVLGRHAADLLVCEDRHFIAGLLAAQQAYMTKDADVRLTGDRACRLRFDIVGSPDGEAYRVVIITDVTEARQQARQIENVHKKEAVRALVGALMHNLNQPLTVITVRAKLMLMAIEAGDGQPEEVRKTLTDIMDVAHAMAETLKRVERASDYSTEPYVGGIEILSIKQQESGDEGL